MRSFLEESSQPTEDVLRHLEHPEDHIFNAGAAGFKHAYGTLMDLHNKLAGSQNDLKVTTKYDGSPSVVFGKNPSNKKFFVASKSAFNKNPKMNYSEADIERNHGHAPGLVDKLKHALKHLPKVTPKSGVYQGDIMHTPSDLIDRGRNVAFKPNTIEYSVPKNSNIGRKVQNSKIGVAVHTAYAGKELGDMKAQYAPDLDHFKEHPDVHVIHVKTPLNNIEYSQSAQNEFRKHIQNAASLGSAIPDRSYDVTEPYRPHLKMYINHTVVNGTTPHTSGFIDYLNKRHEKDIDTTASTKSKENKRKAHQAKIDDINVNREHFDNMFNLHAYLGKAKDVLAHTLSSTPEKFEHSINGAPSVGEGHVCIRNNRPSKIVDRQEFSRANLLSRPR